MLYPANWLVLFLVFGLLAFYLGFLLWAYHTGQVREAEAAKYAVFRDDPEEAPDPTSSPLDAEEPA